MPIPQQPDIIGKYILELCTRIGTRYNFNGYSFLDVMVSEAIENCLKAVLKYNPRKVTKTNNIVNYFTMVAWRAFQFRIIEEREQNAVKHKFYQHTYRIHELDGTQMLDLSDNEHSNKIIEEFERKHINPKKIPFKKTKSSKGVEKLLVKRRTIKNG